MGGKTGDSTEETLITRVRKRVPRATHNYANITRAALVVGIPFYDEADSIGGVVEGAVAGLKEFYPDKKAVLICVGSP